jgi:hypothetical protein
MRWKGFLDLGLGVGTALISACTLAAQTPMLPAGPPTPQATFATPTTQGPVSQKVDPATPATSTTQAPVRQQKVDPVTPTSQDKKPAQTPTLGEPVLPTSSSCPESSGPFGGWFAGHGNCNCMDDGKGALGPTPFPAVGIIQDWVFGKDNKDACIKIGGWADFDYTYNSTGAGKAFNPTGGPGIAPVMNRFGDEFTVRQLGLMISKPLDNKTWSWGFNIIALGGADASFLQPTKGWPAQTDPRMGFDFTDLNLTFHAPILTEGGVDVKIGRQTTILGPMGALAWQRPLNSSDYAWYNMEEGRYTGISSVWHINKQLDWYNGLEWGWGTFYAQKGNTPSYITNITYWLDCEAKDTKVWTTVLTGPTTDDSSVNTTVVEFGILKNWNRYLYTIVDTQMVYSRGPVFGGPVPPSYIERAYDVYTYNGVHLNKCWDFTSRLEYYYDADGQGYAGGFGIPKTSYYAATVGLNYHPNKWVEFRPEVRYDGATNPAFGTSATNLQRNELTVSADILFKF